MGKKMWYFRSCIGFVESSLQREPPQLRKDRDSFGTAHRTSALSVHAELIEQRRVGASPTN
jgi:hypothetical protein